jgi:hypothetical protein
MVIDVVVNLKIVEDHHVEEDHVLRENGALYHTYQLR